MIKQQDMFNEPNTSTQTIIHGDCLDEMRKMADNSIDCIVTDSPYGVSFMGKHWDKGIPSMEYWKEMLRIVKPGGHLLAAGLPRMMHRLICVIEDSGWQVRDLILHLFGSGFPKSHNKFGLEGYGTALKPAWEGWTLCMKPIDGTYAQNAEKWGLGGINIDSTRIEGEDQEKLAKNWDRKTVTDIRSGNYGNGISSGIELSTKAPKGRWPANIIFDEISAELLDQQTGVLKSGGGILNPIGKGSKKETAFMTSNNKDSGYYLPNFGGASRFFYCAKASSSERNKGLDGMESKDKYTNSNPQPNRNNRPQKKITNNHPTVKPLRLMEYLLKLVMPPSPDAIVLDPFLGSGTTLLAAKNLGFNAIGIEREEEYVEIARKRII